MRRAVLVSVAVADRPGALGALASRLGAVGADIRSVTVSETVDGIVQDDFLVVLPPFAGDIIGLIFAELAEVDDAKVVCVQDVADLPGGRST